MSETTDPLAEVAKQIYMGLLGVKAVAPDDESCIESILAELRKVSEEAYYEGFEDAIHEMKAARPDWYDRGLAAGRKQGLEEAANLASLYSSELVDEIQSLLDAGECNCGDLRTCRSLYGNKHGALDEIKKRKKKGV